MAARGVVPALAYGSGSWAIIDRSTRKAAHETHSRTVADAVALYASDRFAILDIGDYLARLNAAIRSGDHSGAIALKEGE